MSFFLCPPILFVSSSSVLHIMKSKFLFQVSTQRLTHQIRGVLWHICWILNTCLCFMHPLWRTKKKKKTKTRKEEEGKCGNFGQHHTLRITDISMPLEGCSFLSTSSVSCNVSFLVLLIQWFAPFFWPTLVRVSWQVKH